MSFSAPVLSLGSITENSITLNWTEANAVNPNAVLLLRVEGGQLIDLTGGSDITVVGGGVVSSAEKKFGSESFSNPGTTSQATNFVQATPIDSGDDRFVFSGDYTMEGWFNITTILKSFNGYFGSDKFFGAGGPGFWHMQFRSGNSVAIALLGSYNGSSNNAMDTGVWQHVASTRAGSQLRMFIDGVKVIEATDTHLDAPVGLGSNVLRIGSGNTTAGDNGDLLGYFEEIRVLNGEALYTEDFTPPTEPFSISNGTADAYALYRNDVLLALLTSAELSFMDTDVVVGQTYVYKVAAYDTNTSDFASDFSNEVSITFDDNDLRISLFDDERVFQGYLGGKLRGKVVAGPWRRVSKTKPN